MCSSCEKVCNSCGFNEMVTYSELCFLQFNIVFTFCLSGSTLSLLWLSFYFLSFLISGLAPVLPVASDQIPHSQDLTRCSNTANHHVGTKRHSGARGTEGLNDDLLRGSACSLSACDNSGDWLLFTFPGHKISLEHLGFLFITLK